MTDENAFVLHAKCEGQDRAYVTTEISWKDLENADFRATWTAAGGGVLYTETKSLIVLANTGRDCLVALKSVYSDDSRVETTVDICHVDLFTHKITHNCTYTANFSRIDPNGEWVSFEPSFQFLSSLEQK